MKTGLVLVEKGQGKKAYDLLEKNGIKTFTDQRFRFDINTCVITVIAIGVIFTVLKTII